MILPNFDYYAPENLQDALEWLAGHHSEGVALLAGGTDLLVNLRGKAIPDGHRPRCQEHRAGPWNARLHPEPKPKWLLSLTRLPELRGIRAEGDEVRIGALTTHTELERSPLVRERLSGLADGAAQLGSPLCRNRGTYGGNLCNARPASDTAIPTLALEGRLVLASPRGERMVEHGDFVLGPGKTVMEPDEILKEVVFTPEAAGKPVSGYIKLGNRKALEIAVAGAAAAVWFGDDGETVAAARVVLAAVAPVPLLVPEAGEALAGRRLEDDAIGEAARLAQAACKPITDHRGGADYRRMMVEVLVRRVLELCRRRAFSAAEEAI